MDFAPEYFHSAEVGMSELQMYAGMLGAGVGKQFMVQEALLIILSVLEGVVIVLMVYTHHKHGNINRKG